MKFWKTLKVLFFSKRVLDGKETLCVNIVNQTMTLLVFCIYSWNWYLGVNQFSVLVHIFELFKMCTVLRWIQYRAPFSVNVLRNTFCIFFIYKISFEGVIFVYIYRRTFEDLLFLEDKTFYSAAIRKRPSEHFHFNIYILKPVMEIMFGRHKRYSIIEYL